MLSFGTGKEANQRFIELKRILHSRPRFHFLFIGQFFFPPQANQWFWLYCTIIRIIKMVVSCVLILKWHLSLLSSLFFFWLEIMNKIFSSWRAPCLPSTHLPVLKFQPSFVEEFKPDTSQESLLEGVFLEFCFQMHPTSCLRAHEQEGEGWWNCWVTFSTLLIYHFPSWDMSSCSPVSTGISLFKTLKDQGLLLEVRFGCSLGATP